MLVLMRKPNESIVIESDIIVTVVEVRGDRVKLGVTAPRDKAVHREEIWTTIQQQKQEAAR